MIDSAYWEPSLSRSLDNSTSDKMTTATEKDDWMLSTMIGALKDKLFRYSFIHSTSIAKNELQAGGITQSGLNHKLRDTST